MIYKVYKKIGETSLQALERLRSRERLEKEKLTFAGRLDPMAEGLILILAGKERFKKDKFNAMDKEYEFELLLGIESDSADQLGIISNYRPKTKIDLQNLHTVLQEFQGGHKWRYPCFSSKTYKGKALFKWSIEEGCPKERPEYRAEIYDLRLISVKKIKAVDLQERVFKNLRLLGRSSISESYNDFRKAEVKKSWERFFKELGMEQEFVLLRLSAKVSKSLYIRSLAERLGRKLGTRGIALSIKRKSFGKVYKINFFGKKWHFYKKHYTI